MKFVLDTNILIDVFRGDEVAVRRIKELHAHAAILAGSIVTKVELVIGSRPSEAERLDRLLAHIEWIDIDDEVVTSTRELGQRYMRSHMGIGAIDYIIAATAITQKAVLLTTNRKHFPMFDALPDPYVEDLETLLG